MGSHSPPRSVHGSRGRSPPRRRSGGDRGRKGHGSVSLLVRNIPLNCSFQPVRVAFERFGPVRDVYMPRSYYSQQPRGFAFVEFADASDASEALLHMNNSMFHGHKITVVIASESRKRPEEMRRQASARRHSDHEHRNTSRYGRSRSRTRSPRYSSRARSRSYSPAPRRRDVDPASPKRKERHLEKSSRQSKEHDKHKKQRSCTPDNWNDRHDADNGSNERHSDHEHRNTSRYGRSRSRTRSPRYSSRARSRSYSPTPRRRDVDSASPKRKERHLEKSSRQSKEHDKHKKQRSCTPDNWNDRHDADNGSNEREATPDYSALPKGKEEREAKSPRRSKEHDNYRKRRSYTPEDRNESNDRSVADNGSNESPARRDGEGSDARRRSPSPASGSHSRRQDDYPASVKTKERCEAKSPRQSKQIDGDKKRRSYGLDDRNDCHDADSAYNEMRHDSCAFPRRKEDSQAKAPRQSNGHDEDKKISYALDDRNDRHDADSGCNERHGTPDNSASSKRKEEPCQTESWKRSKEDEKSVKRIPDDRNTSRDAGHGSKEKPATAAHQEIPPPPEVTPGQQLSDGSSMAK